jgi:hypothetical protein
MMEVIYEVLHKEDLIRQEILRVINLIRNAKSKEELRMIYRIFVYKKNLKDSLKYDDENKYYEYLAMPEEIDPRKIQPKFIVASTKKERRLFRYLTYYWSFPLSEGVGRRLKILVMDEQNNKVIGLIGLKDPVIGLEIRDKHIGWSKKVKNEYLIHVFDAHILGAVPPYNIILGGKLVASLLQSQELQELIKKKYTFRHGFPIVLYTTTAIYGKSTMLTGTNWIYLGDTKGCSTFHLDYKKLRAFLGNTEEVRKYKFGDGPNYPLRLARIVSKKLGMDITNVGIKRGFYIMPLTSNYKEVLNGKEKPFFDLLFNMEKISDYVKEKFIIPRVRRVKMLPPPKVSELMEEVKVYASIKKIPI